MSEPCNEDPCRMHKCCHCSCPCVPGESNTCDDCNAIEERGDLIHLLNRAMPRRRSIGHLADSIMDAGFRRKDVE